VGLIPLWPCNKKEIWQGARFLWLLVLNGKSAYHMQNRISKLFWKFVLNQPQNQWSKNEFNLCWKANYPLEGWLKKGFLFLLLNYPVAEELPHCWDLVEYRYHWMSLIQPKLSDWLREGKLAKYLGGIFLSMGKAPFSFKQAGFLPYVKSQHNYKRHGCYLA